MNSILKDREVIDGIIVPIILEKTENGDIIRATDDYIDINYKSSDTRSRVLSNLNPYEFHYYGKLARSVEAVLQSLKYKDRKEKKKCYGYSGIDSWHLRGMEPYAWQKDGILYTPYGKIDRFSEDYQEFIDKLYYQVFKNPLYRNNLLLSGTRKLDHTHGENSQKLTVLTRSEYISRLYALRYCLERNFQSKKIVMEILEEVRNELNLKRVL